MKINDDVIASIDENFVDVSSGWLWSAEDVYSPDYTSTLDQPISVESSTLNELRFLTSSTTITIRESYENTSRILWAGYIDLIEDPHQINIDNKLYTSALNTSISTGVIYNNLPELIKTADSFIVPDVDVAIYPSSNFRGIIEHHHITSASFSIARDGLTNFVVVDYNSGNPIFRIEQNSSQINQSNILAIYATWNVDGNIHSIGFDNKGEGLSNKTDLMLLSTEQYRRSIDGGLILSTDASNNIILTSAVVYAGTTPQIILPYNSAIDYITRSYHTSGVWTFDRQPSGIVDNLYFDNGTNLENISNNKYAVRWIYRSIGDDKEVFLVYGTNQYNTSLFAKTESLPSVPGILSNHCMLVGRYIIKQGSTEIITESAFTQSFNSNTVPHHNDLLNLQGGSSTLSEYYHLSATTYSYVNSLSADAQNQLRNISANYVPVTRTITAGTGLTGGGNLLGNRTISLATTGTSGIYTKVVTNTRGQVISGTTLLPSDLPNGIDASKINSGVVSNTEFGYLDGVSANIQTQINQLKVQSISGIGAGTPNYISKFVTSGSVGNSHIKDDGTTIFFETEVSGTVGYFSQINVGDVSNTEIQYLNGVSANIQEQINNMILPAIRVTPLKYLVTVASTTWIINHDLDRYPLWTVRISTTGLEGEFIQPDVKYDDENTMTLYWTAPYTGTVCLI